METRPCREPFPLFLRRSALKVYAEDGRPVSELDLSAFFKFLPGKSLEAFSTEHASGSVSQASSILEAVRQSWFYEEIRPLDALCCINRMRGAEFGR